MPVPPAPPVIRTPAVEATAVDSARRFLALVDRDDWRTSWQVAHRSFQALNTVEWWAQVSRQVRGEMGRPLGRELATVDFAGAPPSGYWTVTFRARYSRKPMVTEEVQLAADGADWKVAAITLE